MKALVLCGGLGLRMKGSFAGVPKPLVPVRGRPLLAFIIDGYVAAGVLDIVLLAGDGAAAFEAFAAGYAGSDVRVQVLPTGSETPTGGRLRQAAPLLRGEEAVFAAYGDGVADVDLAALLACHRAGGWAATLTAVRPRLPFGLLALQPGGRVDSFREKPLMAEYTNGGFFVLQVAILDELRPDTDFEADFLPALAARGQLGAYRHEGFWKGVDTYKDCLELERDGVPAGKAGA